MNEHETPEQSPAPAPGSGLTDAPPPQLAQATVAPAPAPSSGGPGKGLAVTALIIGIIALVCAWVPIFGVFLAIIGLVLGIIALVKKQAKAFALTGTILSAVALAIALVVTLLAGLFTAAVVGGIEESTETTVEAPAAPEGQTDTTDETDEASGADLGSRENPLPLGSTISGADWDVVVNSVQLNANEAVAAAFEYNEPPAAGQQYALVNLTATYTGDDTGMPMMVAVDYVTASGEVISAWDSLVIAPEPTFGTSELYAGGSATGNQAFAIPSAADGLLRVKPGILADEVFVAIQ